MALLQVLPHPVQPSAYTSLSDHISRTPSSFFNAPPVLHLHCESCDVQIPSDLLIVNGPLKSVFGALPAHIQASASAVPVQVTFEGISVLVGSDAFVLCSPATKKTLSIPYPLITLHAIQHTSSISSPNSKRFNVYLQITSSQSSPDPTDDLLELIIKPQLPTTKHASPASIPSNTSNGGGSTLIPPSLSAAFSTQETLTKALFDALTRCADLHPTATTTAQGFFGDNESSSDEDDDDAAAFSNSDLEDAADRDEIMLDDSDAMEVEDPITGASSVPFGPAGTTTRRLKKRKSHKNGFGSGGPPGEGGWITAENAHLFDEHGGVKGGGVVVSASGKVSGALGPGAGSVRLRDEVDDEDDDEDAGAGAAVGEAKWRKTG